MLHPTNSNLLPPEYAQLLTSEYSLLRHPKDYYPNEFDVDPYGSIWEHEFIALLPFLDQSVIDQAYNSVDFDSLPEK